MVHTFPDKLFDSGDLRQSGLSLWSTVKLEVQADNSTVPGGISELLTLPDGGLVISATASGIDTRTQDGAIYFARTPKVGVTSARKIRDFPGLKPEGLALSPEAGRLMVVFDRGNELPSWIDVPWPKE